MRKPTTTSRPPLASETPAWWRRNQSKRLVTPADPRATATMGTPSPRQYATMREMPDQAVALIVARARMPLRIGPMHGVQPAPKTMPMRPARSADASRPPDGMAPLTRVSNKPMLRSPATCRPMSTRTAPPMIRACTA